MLDCRAAGRRTELLQVRSVSRGPSTRTCCASPKRSLISTPVPAISASYPRYVSRPACEDPPDLHSGICSSQGVFPALQKSIEKRATSKQRALKVSDQSQATDRPSDTDWGFTHRSYFECAGAGTSAGARQLSLNVDQQLLTVRLW